MKKILLYSGCLLVLASCTKDISRFNEEKKLSATVPAATLFSSATKNLVDGLASSNVNTNVYRFVVQHWAMATYQDEVQYDFVTRNIPQAWWTRLYRDVLLDLADAKRITTADEKLEAVAKTNQLAILDIMEVYSYYILVSTFGNIPYKEALDGNNLFPVYDDAKTIYDDLITRLSSSAGKLSTSGAGFAAAQDLLMGGDVEKWSKFANSLLVKMALNYADVDNTKAKSQFEVANAKAIMAPTDDIMLKYLDVTPNTNPVWVDIVQSGRLDYVSGGPLHDKLKDMSDPRLSLYYKPNNEGAYVGGKMGLVNTYASVSKPSDLVSAIKAPAILLDFVEMEFYRAEAKERGYTVAGTAAEHYNNAIKASILYWGGTDAQANAYLARTDVAYATAAGNWKEKIGTQKWIALYNRGFEGWTELRRLDFPKLTPPTGAKSGFPNRLTYAINEQTLNGANYTSAAAAIGGDKVETKLFWDKF